MESIRVDILNPKARKLLQNLADLNLIKIRKSDQPDFTALLTKLRSKPKEVISLDEISEEVEKVRKSRYEK